MDLSNGTRNWIEAYMEWTEADSWTFGTERSAYNGSGEAGADESRRFAAAYLGWTDARQPIVAAGVQPRANRPDGIDAQSGGQDMLWDAFMVASHTDADCMPFLRELIAASAVRPRAALAA